MAYHNSETTIYCAAVFGFAGLYLAARHYPAECK
jgi:hypothetical protein